MPYEAVTFFVRNDKTSYLNIETSCKPESLYFLKKIQKQCVTSLSTFAVQMVLFLQRNLMVGTFRVAACIKSGTKRNTWGAFAVSSEKLQSLLQYIRAEGRICPQQNKWHELWEMLPDKRRVSHGWDPPLPLILAEWNTTTGHQKMVRLKQHINYADQKGILDRIEKFLKDLKRDEWHTQE